jgi:hypothetical protein
MEARQSAKVIRLYTGGHSIRQVAAKIGLGVATVHGELVKNNIDRRSEHRRVANKPAQVARIIRMYDKQKKPMTEIAAVLEIDTSTVRRRLIANDIAIRSPGGAR